MTKFFIGFWIGYWVARGREAYLRDPYPIGDTTVESETVDIPVDRVEVVVAQSENNKGGTS